MSDDRQGAQSADLRPASSGNSAATFAVGLRNWHLAILGLTLFGLLLSQLLEVDTAGDVRWSGEDGGQWPVVCLWQRWLATECPSCGLTRSLVLLGHGDLQSAWQFHRLGWLVGLLILVQVPYRIWALNSPDGRPLGRRGPVACLIAVCLVLLLDWMIRRYVA